LREDLDLLSGQPVGLDLQAAQTLGPRVAAKVMHIVCRV